ncbi:MAG: hypothetical protein IKN55_06770 [Oscillospiraceae bacterium]|nr:hypothetical protein [Oscillospiraceae bacterium]
MNEKTEQIKAAMADEAFVKSCIEAENEEAVQKLFADKGIEMSLTEIELMKEMVGAVAEGEISEEQLDKLANGGELSEDELEEAAGGFNMFKYTHFKDVICKEDYNMFVNGGLTQNLTKSLSGAGWGVVIGGVAAGVAAIGAAAYGIYKYKDEIGSGISSAYGWVKDNITRW